MTSDHRGRSSAATPARASEHEQLRTLFTLGREVMSVLDFDELLERIPGLIAGLIAFDAFAVYLLDHRSNELRVAYSVGYPADTVGTIRLAVGEGIVGHAVAEKTPMLVNDVTADPRYKAIVPGMRAEIVVPLVHKKKALGALNILSRLEDPFTESDVDILVQFGAHVAVALDNARMFERERRDADAFEALAEIGREVASILDLDELLERIAELTRRLVDYRTFGILLADPTGTTLEFKLAVQYGTKLELPTVRIGEGLVGQAALQRKPVLVNDVSKDPRYIRLVDDVKSELVVPMLVKDRCIGVVDLESPHLNAFSKRDAEIMSSLASQAAVAIENARLYEAVRSNEERLEREVRFAQRVQAALLPAEPPRRIRHVDLAARFAPARELGGDFYDYLLPESTGLVVAVGDVSGKGVPAALYSAFAAELVRSRTFRRRYMPERPTPGRVLEAVNTILHERQLEEFYCTLCYALFDLKGRTVTFANSGLPYPVRFSNGQCGRVELPGVPLGSFPGTRYDEVTFPLHTGDVYVFCSDGVFEAMNAAGEEFGAERLVEVVASVAREPATAIVDAVFERVQEFRGHTPPNDDMTAVALRITGGKDDPKKDEPKVEGAGVRR